MASAGAKFIVGLCKPRSPLRIDSRCATTTHTGAILPEPRRIRYRIVPVFVSMGIGLFIGIWSGKWGANYMQETELFVPDDDSDDDDD